jgi:hypothetical protein
VLADKPDIMAPDIALVWKFTRTTPVRVDYGRLPVPADVPVRKK